MAKIALDEATGEILDGLEASWNESGVLWTEDGKGDLVEQTVSEACYATWQQMADHVIKVKPSGKVQNFISPYETQIGRQNYCCQELQFTLRMINKLEDREFFPALMKSIVGALSKMQRQGMSDLLRPYTGTTDKESSCHTNLNSKAS